VPRAAEALLTRGNRIAWVGTEEECRTCALSVPEVRDLAGAALLPGFVDAHCHPLMHGQFGSWVDCGWETAPSMNSERPAHRTTLDPYYDQRGNPLVVLHLSHAAQLELLEDLTRTTLSEHYGLNGQAVQLQVQQYE
jgi:predicted amidohydrolase YtcJ